MNHRRFLSVLLTIALLLSLTLTANAVPPRDLDYAYLHTTAGYLIVGREVHLEVVLPEGAGGYTYEFTLFYTHDREETGNFQGIDQVKAQADNSYRFTPEKPGQYFVEAVIMDADYRSLTLHSEPFYCYEEGSEADPATLPGKVVQVAGEAEAQGFASQYEKALYLHDWLTHNADYDEPMTIHTPEGVLLRGEGVCESYALAYQMLLRQAGIKSQYVTGYSRGQLHAWNLVHLDGEWTFIDPTWNDPVGGGKEGHDYFGMTDVQLARDHDWSTGKQKPPSATADTHNYLLKNGWMPFDGQEGLAALLTRELADKNPRIQYTYLGEDRYFDTMYEIKKFMEAQSHKHFVDSYIYGGSAYAGAMEVTYGNFSDYIPFTDDAGFLAAMDSQLKAKAPVIKMYYQGDDRYFNYGSYLNRFLTDKAADYGVKSYSYTYYPFHGVAELEYND